MRQIGRGDRRGRDEMSMIHEIEMKESFSMPLPAIGSLLFAVTPRMFMMLAADVAITIFFTDHLLSSTDRDASAAATQS